MKKVFRSGLSLLFMINLIESLSMSLTKYLTSYVRIIFQTLYMKTRRY